MTDSTPMKRVLSGIQPSGQLHLGNYTGAIKQFIDLQADHEMFIFIASYHALTSVRDPEVLRANIRQVAIDYIAFGLDPELANVSLYRQQDVPEVTELAWLLGCVCPKHMMDKATSFKDKVARGLQASIGLYTYPVLQAADILSVDPDLVPVGKDQVQHCEITRDLAQKFNHHFCPEDQPVFRLPDYRIREAAAVLPGIDAQKMSKSYDNTIDPFMDEKPLRKRIMKILSDATPLEDPKDPEADTTFQVFRAIAGEDDPRTADLAARYRAGGLGYGHAKQELFELILESFSVARQRRTELMNDPGYIEQVLKDGAERARAKAREVLDRARSAVGL
ncbi:MAG: tryptophan--tRNA ligase [Phycisphaeraceae bacterium]